MHKVIRSSSIIPERSSNYQEEVKSSFRGVSPNKKIDFVTERPVIKEVIVEVPYDVIIEKPVENRIEKEVIVEKIIEVPVERIIEREVEHIEEQEKIEIIERPVYTERVVDNVIETILEMPVDVEVHQEKEIIQEVPVNIVRNIARPHRVENRQVEVKSSMPQYEDVVVEKKSMFQ